MHRFVLAGVTPVLFAVAGAAQTPPVVTEAEFLSALDASHPAVVERVTEVSLAQARVTRASTLENPTLGLVATLRRRFSDAYETRHGQADQIAPKRRVGQSSGRRRRVPRNPAR